MEGMNLESKYAIFAVAAKIGVASVLSGSLVTQTLFPAVQHNRASRIVVWPVHT